MDKLLLVPLLILLLVPVAVATSENWALVRDIEVPDGSRPVQLYLSEDILEDARASGADLRIYENGVEVPYKLLLDAQVQSANLAIERVTASSSRDQFRSLTFDPMNVIDGDASAGESAYWQVDATTDAYTAWLIVDIGSPLLVSHATFTTTNPDATFTNIQVEGSVDGGEWVVLRGLSKLSQGTVRTVSFAPAIVRYVRFTLVHGGDLIVNEVELFGASKGKIVFWGSGSNKYELFYGNPSAFMPQYDVAELYIEANTPVVYALRERTNPAYNSDPDGDGVTADNCQFIPNNDQRDSDADGVGDVCDVCPATKDEQQRDRDNDGWGDACDNCPSTYNPNQLDKDFDGKGWACDDLDNDGVFNAADNCELGSNPQQEDIDRNGIGDVCEDADGDGIPEYEDNCPTLMNTDQNDGDNDGVGNACDNCPFEGNSDQRDSDRNGIGDVCEDSDNDGISNAQDNCPEVSNPDQVNWDTDTYGDACDNCPSHPNQNQQDIDRDGIGDACDGEESRLLENKNVVWGILILGILVIGFIAFMMNKK